MRNKVNITRHESSVIWKVFERLYNRIFADCGFNPRAKISFRNPQRIIHEPVYIGDIWGSKKIFKHMDTVNSDGAAERKADINGLIRGMIFHKSGMVGYWLWLNLKGYGLVRITLVPQNPNKRKPNRRHFTIMAKRARSGYRILWAILDEGNMPEMVAKMETAPTEIYWNPFAAPR